MAAQETERGARPEDAAALASSRRAVDEAALVIVQLLGLLPFRNVPRAVRMRATQWLHEQAQIMGPEDRQQ